METFFTTKRSMHQKIESIKYNACIAITGAIRGISREKNELLGFESLQYRRWYRKLYCFYQINNEKSPDYLLQLIPSKKSTYPTRNATNATMQQLNMFHLLKDLRNLL